jgi:hypothetical protein
VAEFEFLYNADGRADLLFLDGPVLEVILTAPWPMVSYLADNDLPPYAVASGVALIDTGAAVSVVDESVMTELEIPDIDTILVQTAHGVAELRRYNASMSLPGLGLQNVPLNLAPAGFIRATTNAGAMLWRCLDGTFSGDWS